MRMRILSDQQACGDALPEAARSDESLVEHLISYLIQSHALDRGSPDIQTSICNRLTAIQAEL